MSGVMRFPWLERGCQSRTPAIPSRPHSMAKSINDVLYVLMGSYKLTQHDLRKSRNIMKNYNPLYGVFAGA